MQVLDLQITKVDHLGMLLAQIADLEAQAEALKTELKQEEGHIEGNLYKACVNNYGFHERCIVNFETCTTSFRIQNKTRASDLDIRHSVLPVPPDKRVD